MRAAGDDADAVRLRGLIVVLWGAGLRISEALALTESDLDSHRGAILVRSGECRIRHSLCRSVGNAELLLLVVVVLAGLRDFGVLMGSALSAVLLVVVSFGRSSSSTEGGVMGSPTGAHVRGPLLRDRDDEPAETVGRDLIDGASGEQDFHPRRWRRRYLESYLIWPPAIAAAGGLRLEAVEQQLRDQHGLAVGAHFADSDRPQALLDVRAKEILAGPGATGIFGQFDVSAMDVARELELSVIPEDIKTFLNELIARG